MLKYKTPDGYVFTIIAWIKTIIIWIGHRLKLYNRPWQKGGGMTNKRRYIIFALNEWDDKEHMNLWAKQHGYKDISAVAKRKLYEYLIKCHYSLGSPNSVDDKDLCDSRQKSTGAAPIQGISAYWKECQT